MQSFFHFLSLFCRGREKNILDFLLYLIVEWKFVIHCSLMMIFLYLTWEEISSLYRFYAFALSIFWVCVCNSWRFSVIFFWNNFLLNSLRYFYKFFFISFKNVSTKEIKRLFFIIVNNLAQYIMFKYNKYIYNFEFFHSLYQFASDSHLRCSYVGSSCWDKII
jgi:hypothetical protein